MDRRRYYRILNEANLGTPESYEDFIGRAIERSLILYLNSIEPDQGEKKMFISLKEAVKMDNTKWMTTREAIEEYAKTTKRG